MPQGGMLQWKPIEILVYCLKKCCLNSENGRAASLQIANQLRVG